MASAEGDDDDDDEEEGGEDHEEEEEGGRRRRPGRVTESSEYARSIELPPHEVFRNLGSATRFAIDIGGSLTKLAYYATVQHKVTRVRSLDSSAETSTTSTTSTTSSTSSPRSYGTAASAAAAADDSGHTAADVAGVGVAGACPLYEISEQEEVGARLHFVKFENAYIETCLDFIRAHLSPTHSPAIRATGGGAHKYRELIHSKLGLRVDKEDEITCLIKGCNFVLKNIPEEAFSFVRHGEPEFRFQTLQQPDSFPYLLVNIGSGVSVIKVDSEDEFERIGGSSIGGRTFWGLGALLTKTMTFDELLQLSARGQHDAVDMLVRDIYGGSCESLGLPGDLIASSFGRIPAPGQEFAKEDMAKSLLHMISNNIGQLASMYAHTHALRTVYFGGFFIREHPVTMHTISFGINYWSKGEVQALFLRHEGYLGAIGAFLKGAEDDNPNQYSWGENYAGSSGLRSTPETLTPTVTPRSRSGTFDMLEMDRLHLKLVPLPLLLQPSAYRPDSVDLTTDAAAREYWLHCFTHSLDGVVRRAVASQPALLDVTERAEKFRQKFSNKLETLRLQPCAYGSLTVRSLLDTREHCLLEFDFPDPYSKVKQQENDCALRQLPAVLAALDVLPWGARQLALVRGLLAGNVFDWGAQAVSTVLESNPHFGFEEAKEKLQERPWLVDDYDAWVERMRGAPHRCALIFVDNSGVDIILGVFPLVRELLARGTQVILASNSGAALNDVTHSELQILTTRVAELDSCIRSALEGDRLLVVQSGSSSPCLDLSRVDKRLCVLVSQRGVDLLLVEGMGRAVHTNYGASLRCDALKLAVIKNAWLARRLGGSLFSVVFKYERGTHQPPPSPPATSS